MPTLHESAAALRAQDPLAKLSPRERQVFDLIAAGNKPAKIASALEVTVRTLSTYRARMFRKLNVRSTAEIVRLHVGAVLTASEDRTLVAAALIAGVAAWKPFELAGVGELCIAGMRYATHLDSAGVPELHDHSRRALVAALEWDQRKSAA